MLHQDVLCNMSGIFRDSFQNVVELLDDLFQVMRQSLSSCCGDCVEFRSAEHTLALYPRLQLCDTPDIGMSTVSLLLIAVKLCVQRAAAADEPADMNYIRKHSSAMTDQGLTNSAARLFSNPAGAFPLSFVQQCSSWRQIART